jgi:FtsH-binding integral membrane protein
MNDNQYYSQPIPVIQLDEKSRGTFIARTYGHLFGAIALFTLIEVFLFISGIAVPIAKSMLQMNWALVLGAFMIISWLAQSVAHRATSVAAQYAALFSYVVAESIIFVPLLFVANYYAPGVIASAAIVTALGFTSLTLLVFALRKDFSFLRMIITWGFIVALIAIGASLVFGFQLGTFFSVAMIALAGGAILYNTSNIMLHYPEDRYVAASLELFASVALMFWYVLRLLMGSRR